MLVNHMKFINKVVGLKNQRAEAEISREQDEQDQINNFEGIAGTGGILSQWAKRKSIRRDRVEALEKVADKINNLNVYGGLEGLMNGVVKMA